MTRALAIDLGGTNIRAGLARPDRPGAIEPLGAWSAPRDRTALADLVNGLLERHRCSRLGIAVPGLARATTCRWIPNLPFLDGLDLTDLFPGLRIALANDAQFALLAEARVGAARGMSDAILLAIGTGIGSAVMSGGRILTGANGGATSFGWACADPNDAGDTRHGWLERRASGRALDRIAADAGLEDGTALVERAAAGDEPSLRLLETPARALGTCLAGAVALLDPEAVLVSGGVASALDVLKPEILAALRGQLPPHLRGVDIFRGGLGGGASLAGAGIAAFRAENWDHIE